MLDMKYDFISVSHSRWIEADHQAEALESVRGADGEVRMAVWDRARLGRLPRADAEVWPGAARHGGGLSTTPLALLMMSRIATGTTSAAV